MSDRVETLKRHVSNMAALEKHVREAIERQLEDDDVRRFPDVERLLQEIKNTLDEHVEHLDAVETGLGDESSSSVKEAVSAALGVAAGLIDKVRGNTMSKNLRDDYTALGHVAIGYTMLHTTGLALESPVVADVAVRHLKHITPFITDISKTIPSIVAAELVDDSETVNLMIVEEAVRNTQGAWDGDHVHRTRTTT